MSEVRRPPILMDIVEEHFDELDFLWEHREANVFTPDWTLHDLAQHEERMEAHLDGLRIAGEAGRELVRDRLEADEPSAATAAGLVLLSGSAPRDVDLVLDHFAGGDDAVVDGIRVALRHHGIDGIGDRVRELAAGEAELPAVCACDVLAFHRVASFAGARFLGSEEPLVRRLALGALGRTGQLALDQVADALEDAEPEVRRAALGEAARARVGGFVDLCRSAALRATDPDPECVRFLGALSLPGDGELLRAALDRPEIAADVVVALGASGRAENVPLLLELMDDGALGPDAVRAYRRLTGADDLEGHLPVPREEVAEGEDEREVLPPDPEKARADWARRRDETDGSALLQSGFVLEPDRLPSAFPMLTLESRRDVYLRARFVGDGSVADLELEAPAVRQGAPRSGP